MLETVAIILLIAGVILIITEIFVPGFGVFGISGIIALIAGIIMTVNSIEQAAFLILITVVVVAIIVSILLKLIINRKIKTPLILYESLEESASDMAYFIGKDGKTITDLRPAGKADFDGVTLDVMSSGMFVSKGKSVVVTKIDGNKIIVKESV